MHRPSISVLFPAFNDGGTIASMVVLAARTIRGVTDDFEVIVVNDGSSDATSLVLEELQTEYGCLRVVTHPVNRGYGAALRTGFSTASKELILYTDGDAQYDPREFPLLLQALRDEVDVVNGYKIDRSDPLHRKIIGRMYHYIVKFLFGFKLRDVDCDFRLIRRRVFGVIELKSDSGAICLELVKCAQDAGFHFAQVPVHHFNRVYGKSQFFNFRRLWRTFVQVLGLWMRLVVRRDHLPLIARRKQELERSAAQASL
jgi:glycosyltransferase involved in cell wall biosynthesis